MKAGKKFLLTMAIAAVFMFLAGGVSLYAKDVTLKAGKWAKGTTADNRADNTYYKIKISKTGYIKVDYWLNKQSEYGCEYALYDSKKELVAECYGDEDSRKSTSCFAVKKGTYYLQSQTEPDYDEESDEGDTYQYKYKIRYRFEVLKTKGKKVRTLSKAPVLKKNETVQSLVFPGEKTGADGEIAYYKITVPQKSKITFDLSIGSPDKMGLSEISMVLRDKKGRSLYEGKYKKDAYTWYENGKSTETLEAGTYYLLIRGNSEKTEKGIYGTSTGYYRLKWY